MDSLRKAFERHDINERYGMNLLQQHGIISDNCVTVDDVFNEVEVCRWLDEHFSHVLVSNKLNKISL